MSLSISLPKSGLIVGTALAVYGIGGFNPMPALAAPPYPETEVYSTTLPATADPTDIYYPVLESEAAPERFPLVLMLQGAFVDKADYSKFASAVASYGFVVVVPNHRRTVLNPRTGQQVEGFAAEQRQIHDVLDFVARLEADPTSPLDERIDPDRFAVMGHSLGGYVALSAIRGSCLPLICTGDVFTPPPELDAGVFFGTTFEAQPRSGQFLPIENPVPIALIAGSEDGEANYDRVVSTYEQIQNPPKVLIRVEGANHYGITNENSDRAVNPPQLDQEEAIATIAHWAGQFLRAHLWDDAEALDLIYGTAGDRNDGVVDAVPPPSPALVPAEP
jgi:dienelactone hydrolase